MLPNITIRKYLIEYISISFLAPKNMQISSTNRIDIIVTTNIISKVSPFTAVVYFVISLFLFSPSLLEIKFETPIPRQTEIAITSLCRGKTTLKAPIESAPTYLPTKNVSTILYNSAIRILKIPGIAKCNIALTILFS